MGLFGRRESVLMGLLLVIGVAPCVAGCASTGAARADALDETLALVGMERADLGWTPKGWWPRFPADIPYKLRSFDALFAEPLDTVTYTRVLAEAAYTMLDPEQLAKLDAGRNSRSLFQAVQRLGIDPLFGGFRGYTANNLAEETPLDQAILSLYAAAGRTTSPNTFGMKLPYPKIAPELQAEVAKLPDEVSAIVGQLVLNVVEARKWADLAFRKVDASDRLAVAENLEVGIEMIDAYDYSPAMDDVARSWDQASMWYAGQKCVDALDLARIKLQAWMAQHEDDDELAALNAEAFAWRSPWGWIRISGRGSQQIDGERTLLVIDLGGDDAYGGALAAACPGQPISMALDLGGDDHYNHNARAAGAGFTGVGILIDAAGDDRYEAARCAQGIGQFGLGLLADLGGNDVYDLKYSGQGCGYFGVGLLFDVDGNDRYNIYADGQGLGGVAGVGVLADRAGNDTYTAERKHSLTGRPSYHSPDLDVAVSNAQGVGMGRRGDGSDGHSWAGGLGALLDGGGDDTYTSGNWAMGTGYWFGIGLLHDREGDDAYHGVCYTQATGAHFCIGALVDEAGDDKHFAEENAHSSIAWAHDFTISILLNEGGNDLYRVDTGGLAYGINRSVAMMIDTAGDDTYRTDVPQRAEKKHGLRPGFAENNERFRARGGVGTYFADTSSVSLFLDIGGTDAYEGMGEALPEEVGNNSRWTDPPGHANWADRNFSIGVDRAKGAVHFVPRPVKVPSGVPMVPVEADQSEDGEVKTQ